MTNQTPEMREALSRAFGDFEWPESNVNVPGQYERDLSREPHPVVAAGSMAVRQYATELPSPAEMGMVDRGLGWSVATNAVVNL